MNRKASRGSVNYTRPMPSRRYQPQTEKRDLKCHNCQGNGHLSNECPSPKRDWNSKTSQADRSGLPNSSRQNRPRRNDRYKRDYNNTGTSHQNNDGNNRNTDRDNRTISNVNRANANGQPRNKAPRASTSKRVSVNFMSRGGPIVYDV